MDTSAASEMESPRSTSSSSSSTSSRRSSAESDSASGSAAVACRRKVAVDFELCSNLFANRYSASSEGSHSRILGGMDMAGWSGK